MADGITEHIITTVATNPNLGPWTVRQPSEDPNWQFRARSGPGWVEPMGQLEYAWPGSESSIGESGPERWPRRVLRMLSVYQIRPEPSSGIATFYRSSPTARIDGWFAAGTGGSDWFWFIPIDDPSVRCVLTGKQSVYVGGEQVTESEIERLTLVSIRDSANESRFVEPPAFEFPEVQFSRWWDAPVYIGLELNIEVTFEGEATITFGHAPPEITYGLRISIPEWVLEGSSWTPRWFSDGVPFR